MKKNEGFSRPNEGCAGSHQRQIIFERLFSPRMRLSYAVVACTALSSGVFIVDTIQLTGCGRGQALYWFAGCPIDMRVQNLLGDKEKEPVREKPFGRRSRTAVCMLKFGKPVLAN